MRKQALILAAATLAFGYPPSVRLGKHGRPMRDPEGHPQAGSESQGTGDNAGGNPGNSGQAAGNAGTPANNNGNEFDPSSFWNSPSEGTPAAAGNGGSAGGNPSGDTKGNPNQGNAFAEALGTLSFGQGVYTQEAADAMGNGDPAPFNNNMQTFGREVTRQSVIMAAQLMQRNNEAMEARFQQLVEERFGQRDTETDLSTAIPSYSKPGMKPVVDGIMAQAMKLTKGKRPEAIEMTKQMLQIQARNLGQDFNITTPPGGAGNDFGTGQTTNWEEELLGRN